MATQQGQNPSAPLNSNKISIVTKSEIRYEGILYHINPQDQNITLCNVKSFGTEGRRPGDEIAPSPQIHEYIIFRGSDIKDLRVLEAAPQPELPNPQNIQSQPTEQAPKDHAKETSGQEIKMKQGQNQEDFDFQGMKERFQQFALEHKQPEISVKTYKHDDFFDSLSTSTAEKTRETPFDRVAQKKTDKETFGSEYVDTATHRGGRGGFRRGNRGGYNRNYGGGRGGHNRNYEGGNRNYEGGNRNYEGGNRNYEGGNRNYEGGHRKYEGGQQRNYEGGQQRNYEGGQQRNYESGHRNYEGGQTRNYEGGQQRNYEGGHRNYEGGQNRNYEGGQNRNYGGQRRYGGGQGGYGGNKEGGYGGNQGGQGGQGGYQGGRKFDQEGGGYSNQGKYYKNYQNAGNQQGDERPKKYDNQQQDF